MQSAKFIDLTRTFLPIDPNSFPTSMHGTKGEDSPEERIPVQAYEGQNFIPTAQGYRSYFGTTAKVNINALGAKADFVFVYQNTNFENILIALTETGIWIKKGSVVGAWTQIYAVTAPIAGVHYDWSFVVIAQVLYCYQANQASYQKIVSDITAGVALTSVVPSFLNMAGQVGIFRAGGRLGFWDTSDSIGWSNQDDYADFTPSLLTLAGNAKFIDINGRITTIVGHGPGFMIYCTKAVVYIYPSPEATYQWKPQVIYSTTGVTYPRQVVAAQPDTTHFAYLSNGLNKIENAKEEVIVTEVTDALATHKGPVYLSIYEGRYLCLEVLDRDFFEGQVQFTKATTGEMAYYFPGTSLTISDAIAEETLNGTNFCATIEDMSNGKYAAQPATPGDKKAGTFYTPMYTAYLSNMGNKDVSNITWGNTPVATIDPLGVEANQCPNPININTTASLTTDGTLKTIVTGADAYLDGKWTMQRFTQAQQAIWNLEQDNITAFINLVEARTKTVAGTPTYYSVDGPIPANSAPTINKALINTYVTKFTEGQFGFSKCEFWLTRYCIGARNIYRNKRNHYSYSRVPAVLGLWRATYLDGSGYQISTGYVYASEAAAKAFLDTHLWGTAGNPGGFPVTWALSGYNSAYYLDVYNSDGVKTSSGRSTYVIATGVDAYGAPSGYVSIQTITAAYIARTDNMLATNIGEDVEYGPIPDTGYCTLTGWKYTKTNDTTGTIAAAGCAAPAEYPPGSTIRIAPLVFTDPDVSGDGSFCSIPFEPVTVPGLPSLAIEWPSETVTLPATSFLLQNGSIAPIYPTFEGALVYDLQLKKWGKYKGQYKVLVNYSPLNNAVNGGIPYANFGILGGIVDLSGYVRLFDYYPEYSYITYGKVGYYRLGNTTVEEVHADFSTPSTGFLIVDTSIEGRFIDPALSKSVTYADAASVELTGANPGSWMNITIGSVTGGTWNINYLEFRGFQQGRR